MLISSMLIGMALQADPARAPREAFARCLNQFVQTSVNDRKSVDAFRSELPQQCTAQSQAYREAMIRRDVAARVSQAEAEQAATEEIAYTLENARESFIEAAAPQ